MPTSLQGRTRAQLTTSVARNLGAVKEITAQSNGSTTTFKYYDVLAAASDFVGYFIKFLSGANSSGHSQVTISSAPSSGVVTLTFAPAATSTTTDDTALLLGWEGAALEPERIYGFLNDAMIEATGLYFDPEESLALHADGRTLRYDIPSEFAMLRKVWYRERVESAILHNCDTVFSETTDADFTQAVDSQDRKNGSSLKLTVAVAAAAGDFITAAISALDISQYDYLEGWVKSTVALTAADYKVHLDSGVVQGDATDLEVLSLPAVSADTWTYFRVALANPESDTAIVSIGIEMDQDKGAHTVWFDDLKVVRDSSAEWREVSPLRWHIDHEARDLILHDGGVGYALLKLQGGDKPALFTADGTVTEVPEDYVVARATALALMAGLGAPTLETEARRQQAAFWSAQAEQAKRAMTGLSGVRMVAG